MTTKRPDAIVTDLDGSLLGPDGKVGKRDLTAIRRMRELGVPVLPGTGRPPIRARSLVQDTWFRSWGWSWPFAPMGAAATILPRGPRFFFLQWITVSPKG